MLDEPLAALDATLRRQLLAEMAEILRGVGVTAIYVTHDREEALAVADRAAVMRAGRIVQSGRPRDLVEKPADAFVASFLELGAILEARPARRDGTTVLLDGSSACSPPPGRQAGRRGTPGFSSAPGRSASAPARVCRGSGRASCRRPRTPWARQCASRFRAESGASNELELILPEIVRGRTAPCPAAGPCSVWIDMSGCQLVKAETTPG